MAIIDSASLTRTTSFKWDAGPTSRRTLFVFWGLVRAQAVERNCFVAR